MSLLFRDAEEAARDVASARGLARADLLVRGCTLLNLFTEAEEPADIAIRAGVIVAIRKDWNGETAHAIDGRGMLALPGLIAPWSLTGVPEASERQRLFAEGTTTAVVAGEGTATAPLRGIDVAALRRSGFAEPRGCALGEALAVAVAVGAVAAETSPVLCFTSADVRRRLRLGLPIFLGGAGPALGTLVAELVRAGVDLNRLNLASGERGALLAVIAAGVAPALAVRMASLNVAAHFGVDYALGAVAPGRRADIVLVETIDARAPRFVIADGAVVAERGILHPQDPPDPSPSTHEDRPS